jgi:hypothetical protein
VSETAPGCGPVTVLHSEGRPLMECLSQELRATPSPMVRNRWLDVARVLVEAVMMFQENAKAAFKGHQPASAAPGLTPPPLREAPGPKPSSTTSLAEAMAEGAKAETVGDHLCRRRLECPLPIRERRVRSAWPTVAAGS